MRIALHMIVSGSETKESVLRAIRSLQNQVDGAYVCITTPMKDKSLKKELEKEGVVVEYRPNKFQYTMTQDDVKFISDLGLEPEFKEGEKIFLFDKARNFSMNMVPKRFSWLIWIDSDDIFRGDKLREIVEQAEKENLDSIFLNYIYHAEIVDGKIKNILIEHLRERIIRNTGVYEWVAPIHETLIEKRPTRKKDFKECDVLHLSDDEKKLGAIDRNVKVLQYSICSTKAKDPRPLYYLAKAYYDIYLNKNDVKYLQQAKKLFELYLSGENPSGWAEERSQCWEYLVEVYRTLGEFNNAIKCAHNAMIEDERFPSIYINLAMCYLMKKEYSRALFWVRLAAKLDQPNTTLVVTPRDLMGRTLEIIYHASLNTNLLDEARASATKLLEMYPNNPEMKNRYTFTHSLTEQREVTKLFVGLANYLSQTGQGKSLTPLMQSVPAIIKDNPFIVDLRKKVTPPRIHLENEISIYCGPAYTQWSPRQLDNPGESFVGGSEEAVIYLSKELAKQGWKVTVYGDPGSDEGNWEGVTYLPYYAFNTGDEFNILVGWRRVDLVDQNLRAKKIYIWCHDIQNQLEYTEERLKKIHKVIVLSQWHRQNIPNVPDEKILISGNGITLDYHDVKKDPKKIFYGSSYDRGLEHLLKMWAEIKKEVPEATLEIAYGWQLFEKFYANNPASMAWKQNIDELMKQDGITHHGRLSQKKVAELMEQCGVWAYPTHFGEISCINAMKAQALGCIPVVVNYAALQETVQHGVKVDGDIWTKEARDSYREALIKTLKDNKFQEKIRPEMMKWARNLFRWENVAIQWSSDFANDELMNAAKLIMDKDKKAHTLFPVQLQAKLGVKQTL